MRGRKHSLYITSTKLLGKYKRAERSRVPGDVEWVEGETGTQKVPKCLLFRLRASVCHTHFGNANVATLSLPHLN